MKKPKWPVPFAWCVALMSMALFCSRVPLAGGDGTETGNARVVGKIVDSLGNPVQGARVLLLPADYDPEKVTGVIAADTTDTLGEYVFAKVFSGVYSIQALHRGKSSGAIIREIQVSNRFDTRAADTLKPPGSVRIALPANANLETGYMYIPGTTFFTYLKNSSGFVMLDSVAVDKAADIAYSTTNSSGFSVLRFGVQVKSFDTAVVWNPGWNYARKFTLNTSSSGVGVSGAVTNFPVLIRLTADNFNFTQARNNGEDIRFTKTDNSFLPYEIERWDAINKRAEVWVKADTVHGSDSTQTLTMYWGASTSSAASISNSQAVFDTGGGFLGAWHLGDAGSSIHDATGGCLNGMNSGATATEGMIGNSMNFANGNFIKIPGLLHSPSSITLSAWVRSDKTTGQDVVSLGNAVLIRFDDVNLTTAGCFHNDSVDNDQAYAIVCSGRFLAKTGWHYLTFSIDAAASVQTLYIDGAQITVTHYAKPINYAGLGTNTYIGKHGNGQTTFNFVGKIDEVRVSRIALSSDWIKLCFMNQKQQDALVRWQR